MGPYIILACTHCRTMKLIEEFEINAFEGMHCGIMVNMMYECEGVYRKKIKYQITEEEDKK